MDNKKEQLLSLNPSSFLLSTAKPDKLKTTPLAPTIRPEPERVTLDKEALQMVKDNTTSKRQRLGVDKLTAIQFDPIDRLVEQVNQIETLINQELAGGNKPRVGAITSYVNSKIRIFEVLLPYAYGKLSEAEEEKTEATNNPLEIRLTFGPDNPSDTDTGES